MLLLLPHLLPVKGKLVSQNKTTNSAALPAPNTVDGLSALATISRLPQQQLEKGGASRRPVRRHGGGACNI